jgi:nanoRNase/pAp phosphatase (c-di-AMP/oligoRNAs hydrolase)
MVDSQPDHHDSLLNMAPDVIIDHHPVSSVSDAPFMDIRPKYGAAASILVEYLRAANIKPSAKLATALYYAIKTDTSNFERKTRLEDLTAPVPKRPRHYILNNLAKLRRSSGPPFYFIDIGVVNPVSTRTIGL